MQLSSHPIAANPSPSASIAAGKAAGCDNAATSDDGAFARLLAARQNAPHHEAAKPPAERRPEKTAQPPRAETNETAQATASQATPAQGTKTGAPEREKADARDTPRASHEAEASTPADAPDAAGAVPKEEAGATSHDSAPADPAWVDWFAAMNRPLTPPAQGLAARGALDATPAESVVAGGSGHALPTDASHAARADAAHADAAQARAAERNAFALDTATAAVSTADSVAASAEHDSSAPRIERLAIAESATTIAAALMQATPHTDNAGAVPNLSLPTPATAPEFPAALGVQVSLLARDGVQHAQLHLNPAEMGPISIRIALNGTQAQVDFGADSAQTRQIIESGLPELAAALRDAGLTLSGGGVSQHSKGRSNDGDAPPDKGSSGARAPVSGVSGDSSAATRSVNLRVPTGRVDLYV
jgi:flagellar hook-length control protein FliK